MAKTLRFRTRVGWTTKPPERTEANRLLAEEIDDNFLALEDQALEVKAANDAQRLAVFSRSDVEDYTLVLGDAGGWVRVDRPTASTVIVPAEATTNFEIGTRIWVRRAGVGSLVLVPDTGVTITCSNTLALASQHAVAQIIKVGADIWDASGDLT
jgi:hypothetical protein